MARRRRAPREPEEWEPREPEAEPGRRPPRCPSTPPHATAETQREAEAAVEETAETPDFAYTGDIPLGETWAMVFAKHRDSGLLDESNYDSVFDDLKSRFPADVDAFRASHWAVGWIDHVAVRMLDRRGCVTRAGVAALEWKGRLDDYPVADEEDYSRREYEATIENIKFEGGLTDKEAGEVHGWLTDNNPGAVESGAEDRGAYPSSEQIEEALVAMGLKEPEPVEAEEEEPEEPPRFDDPAQLRFRFPD